MSPGSLPLVSVVLLCHDRPQLLVDALQSIAAQRYPKLEVLVVHNPSPHSEAIRSIVQQFPDFRLIVMPHNAGYTGGMNEGIRQATGKYIYITEEDMVTAPDAVAAMVAYMESDPQCATASGIHDDQCGVIVHAGGFIQLGGIYRLFVIGRDTPVFPPLLGPFCASYITGAMMLLRRSTIEELGAFRQDFFMYHDDVELCVRFLRHGKTLVIVPSARAKTLANLPTAKTSALINFHKFKNLFATYLLHAPAGVLPEFFARYAGITLLRHMFRDPAAALALLRAEFWITANFPRLLRERKQLAASCRECVPSAITP